MSEHYSLHVGHDVSYSEQGWRMWSVRWPADKPELADAIDFIVDEVQLMCRDCEVELEGIDL